MEKRVIIIRWLGIIVGITTVPFLELQDSFPMYLLIGYALVHNTIFQFFIIPYRNHWLLKSAILTISDNIMTSLAVYLTGGLDSDFYLIYFLLAVLSAIRFGRREAMVSTLISTVLYVLLVVYKASEPLTSMNIAVIILRMGFVVITGVFAGYLGDRTRQIEIDLEKELDKAYAQLNKSITLLNQNPELKDVLSNGTEQACRLINAEFCMTLMDESNTQFLERDFKNILLKPYIAFNSMGTEISEKNVQKFVALVPELIQFPSVKLNTVYKNKKVKIYDCKVNKYISEVFSVEEGSEYFLISIPLLNGDKKIGTMYLVKFNEDINILKEIQVDIVFLYAQSIASAIASSIVSQSKRLAITDPVTGLYNHRFYQETIKIELGQCLASKKLLSLIVLDIDTFKQFNDTYGHSVGDIALKSVAKLIQDSINGIGWAARYGGDEFVIVLPSMSNQQACEVAELIRTKKSDSFGKVAYEALAALNLSFGVATAPLSGKTPEDLFNTADSALYIAKYSGKNLVQSAFKMPKFKAMNEISIIPKYLENKKIISLQKAFSKNSVQDIELIEAFIAAVDARDHYTYDHSEHVSNYSVKLARKMNLSDEEIERIRLGALLHDIGKIGIPDNILNKIGNLTNEEYEVIKQHPIIGTKIIEPIKSMGVYGQIILHHHEWFDGTGYPYGLKESEIPLEARIVSICDVYDAMTTDRSYRSAIPKEKALQIIKVMVGSQFDPEVWLYFNEMITNDTIPKTGENTNSTDIEREKAQFI